MNETFTRLDPNYLPSFIREVDKHSVHSITLTGQLTERSVAINEPLLSIKLPSLRRIGPAQEVGPHWSGSFLSHGNGPPANLAWES